MRSTRPDVGAGPRPQRIVRQAQYTGVGAAVGTETFERTLLNDELLYY